MLEVPIHRDRYKAAFVDQTIAFDMDIWNRTWSQFSPRVGLTFSRSDHIAWSATYGLQVGTGFFGQRGDIRLDLNF